MTRVHGQKTKEEKRFAESCSKIETERQVIPDNENLDKDQNLIITHDDSPMTLHRENHPTIHEINPDGKNGRVYLLRCPDNPPNIWKLGQTTRLMKHRILGGYPKGAEPYFQIEVFDCYGCEQAIKREFKKQFIQCKDRGTEWFEGDIHSMIQVMLPITNAFRNIQ